MVLWILPGDQLPIPPWHWHTHLRNSQNKFLHGKKPEAELAGLCWPAPPELNWDQLELLEITSFFRKLAFQAHDPQAFLDTPPTPQTSPQGQHCPLKPSWENTSPEAPWDSSTVKPCSHSCLVCNLLRGEGVRRTEHDGVSTCPLSPVSCGWQAKICMEVLRWFWYLSPLYDI